MDVESLWGVALRYARWRGASEHEAEDVAQDAIVSLLDQAGRGRVVDAPRAYIARTVENLLRDRWRRRRGRVYVDVEEGGIDSELAARTPAPGPDERLEAARHQAAVSAVLETFPGAQRQQLQRWLAGESVQQLAAEELGIAVEALDRAGNPEHRRTYDRVQRRLHRLRERFRLRLHDALGLEEEP